MGLKDVKTGKLLYHLTDIENLPSIVKHGLLSRNELNERNFKFTDIANPDIIEKRKLNLLNDYIPLHFHPYSAFDYAVRANHPGISFIYLCIKRSLARAKKFYILPRHPLSEKDCELFSYDEGFNNIDWATMCKTNDELKSEHIDEHYAKMIKMAECLVPTVLSFDNICSIYVKDEDTKQRIIKYFTRISKGNYPYVNINKNWFKLRGE